MPTYRLLIKGKVQEVFFRASAKIFAEQAGITGWVKNTAQGDVEAVVSGTESQVQHFADWCKKGPPSAKVSAVVMDEMEETAFDNFLIKR